MEFDPHQSLAAFLLCAEKESVKFAALHHTFDVFALVSTALRRVQLWGRERK
jgi:hypothetical protein